LTASGERRRTAIGFIVCLGVVSLFADMTYEGAHSAISPLLRDLGASAAAVGFIAGLGEMLGASLRFFSGRLASRTHAYWSITFFGYAMNVIAVPALAQEQEIKLKPGPGLDKVEGNCAACHTLAYIEMNSPFLNADGWNAEVTKMIKVMGAPIGDADAKVIADYLAKNYGP